MTENKDILDAIAKMLIEQEKMNGLELLQLIQNMKPKLVPEGSAAKLREFVGKSNTAALPEPALAAMQKLEQSEL